VLTLYAISDEARPSHFTKLRLLDYLHYNRNHTSAFGLGFVRTEILADEFAKIGTSGVDLHESLRILALHSLVENDSYDSKQEGRAYRSTPAGRYYLRYLAVRFSYLDLVLQDTPIGDPAAFDAIMDKMDSKDMDDRFSRVETFLQYLENAESREYAAIKNTTDSIPLRRRVFTDMMPEFRNERRYIERRLSERLDKSGQVATPYTPLG
jgi:hypothetical protein